MKPTQSDIRRSIMAFAPDQSPEGKAKLEAKLAFMEKAPIKPYKRKPKEEDNRGKIKNRDIEAKLQMQIVQYLNTQPRILFWANNPQVFVGKMTHARLNYLNKLKRMGHKKGVPDICLFFQNRVGRSVFCFLELKAPNGTPSEEQLDFMFNCDQRGGYSAVIKSLGDLISLLKRAGY